MALKITGFFSYAHNDDTHDVLTKMRNNLCAEYRSLTGEDLQLFFDRDSIEWGDRWQENIVSGIESCSFFIPIYSPCYFSRSFCISEFEQFSHKIDTIKAPCLILPILFAPVKADYLNLDKELIDRALTYQYEDWTDVRFKPESSEEYLRAINKMALKIIHANQELITSFSIEIPTKKENSPLPISNDDEPTDFFLDSLNEIESLLNEVSEVLINQTSSIDSISCIFKEGTEKMNSSKQRGGGTKEALVISASVANKLKPITSELEEQVKSYSDLVNKINPKMITILPVLKSNPESDERNETISNIKELVEQTRKAQQSTKSMAEASARSAKLSRALYRPSKQIENSLALFIGASDIIVGWENLL